MTPNAADSAPADEPQRYFFVHVPKTAGTALFVRLRNQFGYMAVYPTPEYEGRLETSIGIEVMLERFARDRDRLRVITGHFPLCAAEMLGVPVSTFTVLRDPVERILSFLRQQQVESPEFRDMPIEKIYETTDLRWSLLTNYMVRQFSTEVRELSEGPQWFDEDRVDMAKANLAHVDVVGLQEDFDGFCANLESRFGWDLGDPVKVNRTTPQPVENSLRDRIAEDNWADIELYGFAVDLVRGRRQSS